MKGIDARGCTPARAGAALVAVLLVVGAGLAACGIPTDDSPRLLAADTAITVGAPSSAPAGSANSIDIYLSAGEATEPLVAQRRGLDGEPNPERALEAVLSPPTNSDLDNGLSTFIPPESAMLDLRLSERTLTIDLNEAFYTQEGEAAVAAFAQVVLTLTGLPSDPVDLIRFQREGDPIQAFTGTGGTKDVVTRTDYRTLDPRAS